MWQHFIASFKSGFRGRSFHAVFIFAIMMLAVAWLAAAFSARQPQAVALDVGLSGVRFSMTILVLVWVQELVSKEIDRRTVFFVLSYPASRNSYILGRYCGIAAMAFLATIFLGSLLLAVTRFSSWGYLVPHELHMGWPYWAVLVSIFVDLLVITAFAILLATFASSSAIPLALGMCFAIASRMLGPVFSYLKAGADGDTELIAQFSGIIRAIHVVIPDLDRLDLRDWVLYGLIPDSSVLMISYLMAFAYIALLMLIACIIFKKREFA